MIDREKLNQVGPHCIAAAEAGEPIPPPPSWYDAVMYEASLKGADEERQSRLESRERYQRTLNWLIDYGAFPPPLDEQQASLFRVLPPNL